MLSQFSYPFNSTSILYIYYFVWSNLNFLHNSQWITFPIQSCLGLILFCAISLFESFSNQRFLVVFLLSFSDSKSPLIRRSILTNLISSVVWRVSIIPLISSSSHPLSKPLVTIPSMLTTIGITVTLRYQDFLFSGKIQVFVFSLSYLFVSFYLIYFCSFICLKYIKKRLLLFKYIHRPTVSALLLKMEP